MIFRFVRPDKVQKWIATNAPGSLKAHPRDSWRAYMVANGGTGTSVRDIEMSFLLAAGATGSTLYDKWQSWLVGNGGLGAGREKAQSKFQ